MKTLKLFNAVLKVKSKQKAFISELGYIIEPGALWAKQDIIDYYDKERLDGNDLNKTFHKSWRKIKKSSRFELFLEQITHYITTYGTNFQAEAYIPDELMILPGVKLVYKVIKAYTRKELIEKCLALLESGVAMKEDTINDVLTVLCDQLDYEFTGEETIRNKEAMIKIADLYGVYPTNTMEFFRLIIYRATGESLLIKSRESIQAVKESNFNPSQQFKRFGLKKLAEIFNRFKPLFIAFKSKCPSTINKISRLSKKHHKPLIQNPLNHVTSRELNDEDFHWLDNATPFALFKALIACYVRKDEFTEAAPAFVYRIRNGKSFVKEKRVGYHSRQNYDILLRYISSRLDLSDKKFYIPNFIKYALPTSEKMFVGNIPTGTKFIGKKLAVGIYWENDWGARDLDLSGLNERGKVGWNSNYSQEGELMFSGDITDAPNGAVEYLYANNGLTLPTIVNNNVFSGKSDCDYKIVVGKGDKISRDYMMNPNKLMAEMKCKSVQKQTVLGLFLPEKKKQSFVVLNFGSGHLRISRGQHSEMAIQALFLQWTNPFTLNKMIKHLGGELVSSPEEADFDLSIDSLERDTFIRIFS